MRPSPSVSPLYSQLAASAGGATQPFPQAGLLAQLRTRLGQSAPYPDLGMNGEVNAPDALHPALTPLAQAAGTKRGPRVIGPGGPFGGRASY